MRTLISNLNVIRDTRICGILRNGFDRISTALVGLTGDCLGTVGARSDHRMSPLMAFVPVMGPLGKPLYAVAVEKASEKPKAHFGATGFFAGDTTDQPCPWHPRLVGRSQISERPVRQRSSQPTAG